VKFWLAFFIFLFPASWASSMSWFASCPLSHSIQYTSKGSKSEARHGYLFLEGEKVPDVFSFIASISVAECSFKFKQRVHKWGLDGYHPSKTDLEKKIKFTSGTTNFKKKYYLGKIKYKNTPEDWFFVEWDNQTAFVASDYLFKFINAFKLKDISRRKVRSRPIIKSKE